MILSLGFTEQSVYRWFKEDNMEVKNLQKIADYFGVGITYFFDEKKLNEQIEQGLRNKVNEVRESVGLYGKNAKDLKEKYIDTLEELNSIIKENAELKIKLSWYETNCECGKTKQPSEKRPA